MYIHMYIYKERDPGQARRAGYYPRGQRAHVVQAVSAAASHRSALIKNHGKGVIQVLPTKPNMPSLRNVPLTIFEVPTEFKANSSIKPYWTPWVWVYQILKGAHIMSMLLLAPPRLVHPTFLRSLRKGAWAP